VGEFTARLQAHGARFSPPAGFVRGPVEHVTSFGRTQPDGLAPEVAERAAALLDDVHPDGWGSVVAAVTDRARAARDAISAAPGVFG
jgi:hypothetical protein